MNTITSHEQFKPIRMGENVVLIYVYNKQLAHRWWGQKTRFKESNDSFLEASKILSWPTMSEQTKSASRGAEVDVFCDLTWL